MRARRSIPLGLALCAMAACGGTTLNTQTAEWVVEYSVAINGVANIDSLKYDNGQGTMVRLLNPTGGTAPTTVALVTPTLPFTVQMTAWVRVTSGTVHVYESWTHTGVSYNADSLSTSSTGALAVPQHVVTQ